MAYSRKLTAMLGEEVGGGGRGLGEGGHYSLLTKFFKILYMLKMFYMVELGSYETSLTNLSEISSPFLRGVAKYVS